MTAMRDLADLGLSYDEALSAFERSIEDARRTWASRVLESYPYRANLEMTATALLVDIEADQVEVNAITDSTQETIAKAPPGERSSAPIGQSLCCIVVAMGTPAAVSDIQGNPFTAAHAAKERGIRSWASAPIFIDGAAAGTICALESHEAREWTLNDQRLLEKAAGMISDTVSDWADGRRHHI